MHVGSLAPSTSHPPFLFAGEALHPPLLCALTFAPHLFFAGLALHPPSALRPQLCTPPLFCGLSFAGIKGFPKLKSLNAYFLAKIGADTAENERNFAEICQKLATTLQGPSPGPNASKAIGCNRFSQISTSVDVHLGERSNISLRSRRFSVDTTKNGLRTD